IVAKEHDPELDITIFFIDLRAHGKGFEEFTNRAKELGIKYIRCEVPEVVVNDENQNLTVLYEDPVDNQLKSMDLDLVVLSVGLVPPQALSSIQAIMGLSLNRFGYVDTPLTNPVETSIPGVFVCGTSQGPKDIPDSVVQASAAAAKAEVLLSSVRDQLVRRREYPKEKEIKEEPRIGVFVCHCGINIGGIVDVPEVVEYVKTLPFVVYAERNLYTCSQDTQEKIKKAIKEYDLNRVVVASCTPRTHEPLFQNTLREAGLNPYLFEFCNIREQCSWVHMHDKRATEKAKDLLRMAVSRSRLLRPLKTQQVPVVKSALVIGGGISGMTASLDIADQGFQVYLVEKQSQLGGFLHNIGRIQDGTTTSDILESVIKRVENHPRIEVFKESEVTEVSGFVGNFRAKINTPENTKEIQFGAAIIAIGADVLMPEGYFHFGENEGIITQKELEAMMDANFRAKKVVMIQCVGSREDNRPYCSRVCCTEAIKNGIRIKRAAPNTEVYVLYRDIRSYGQWETLYREARDLGVVFMRYSEENKPSVDPNDLTVEVYEPLFKTKLKLKVDLVVLGSAITPPKDAEALSKMFKVPLDENGFFLEAHMKLRPVDFATDGVFVCGTAHYPKMIHESIAQASAAASRACLILSKDTLESEAVISLVDEEKCKGCGECIDVCPFEAIELQPEEMVLEKVKFPTRKAHINPIICKGCGSCAVVCPVGAITPEHFTKQQIEASLEAAIIQS
ncbi:MAG: FAD-dependent oxidoreductase, partial [Candidatus Bathyarchaeia archaeon]